MPASIGLPTRSLKLTGRRRSFPTPRRLLDEIAFAQRFKRALAAEEFQLWVLVVAEDRTLIAGVLNCRVNSTRH